MKNIFPAMVMICFLFSFRIEETKHILTVSHPGKTNLTTELVLIEKKNLLDSSSIFYTDVVSVYCYNNVCKIDNVRLFWNEIGEYERYKLAENITLEKKGSVMFSEGDYLKLHGILKDKKSPFSALKIHEILGKGVSLDTELDGYSGATILELNEEKTISGATLTCYTLWHWANGDLRDQIRKIASQDLKQDKLRTYLSKKDGNYRLFVLEYLLREKIYSKSYIEEVLQSDVKNASEWNDLQLEYLEAASTEIYLHGIKTLIKTEQQEKSIIALRSLKNRDINIGKEYFEDISWKVLQNVSYQELDLFLTLIEQHKIRSSMISDQLFGLLDGDIFIARRAYEHLVEKENDTNHKKKLRRFLKEHGDSL